MHLAERWIARRRGPTERRDGVVNEFLKQYILAAHMHDVEGGLPHGLQDRQIVAALETAAFFGAEYASSCQGGGQEDAIRAVLYTGSRVFCERLGYRLERVLKRGRVAAHDVHDLR